MIKNPRVGMRVRSTDEDCCNGHAYGDTGTIVVIDPEDLEQPYLVKGDSTNIWEDASLWCCDKCLEEIKDGNE